MTSEVMEAVRGQKHPLEAKKGKEELIYQKKYLMKVSQQPQKPLSGSNQMNLLIEWPFSKIVFPIYRVDSDPLGYEFSCSGCL